MNRPWPEDVFEWPGFGLNDDVRPLMARARLRGERSALATIIGVDGGAPRGLGAQMAFSSQDIAGFLSGGCIEADVALHAAEVLAGAPARRLTYGEGGPADIRLPCGSRLEILLERVDADDPALERLLALRSERRPGLWLTDGALRETVVDGDAPAIAALRPAARQAAAAAEAGGSLGDVAFRRHPPPLRIVVVGSEPIALALAGLAERMACRTTLVRPKGPAAGPWPGLDYRRGPAADTLKALRLDPWTAVAVLTHEGELEEEALSVALPSPAAYVGVLGSRRRIDGRNARLSALGVADADIARLKAPIGLPIGGKSPYDIGLSILAEIVETLNAPGRRADIAPSTTR